jgi:hypothetical protein
VFDEYFQIALNKNYENIGKRRLDDKVFDTFLRQCLGCSV